MLDADTLRAICHKNGVPLRGQYGYEVDDITLGDVIEIILATDDDEEAIENIQVAIALGDIEIASGYDTPAEDRLIMAIVGWARMLDAA